MLANYEGKFRIFDEYKIDQNSNLVLSTQYGDWDPVYGLTVYEENIWKRRSNLQGYPLKYEISISNQLRIISNLTIKFSTYFVLS